MRKIKNLEDLENCIISDIAWRKKEIAEFHLLCHSNNNPTYLVRGCFVLVCAHFEGAIRFSSNAYLAYISGQSVKGTDLKPEINAIAVRKKTHNLFVHTGGSKVKVSSVTKVLREYDDLLSGTFSIKTSDDDLLPEDDESEPVLPTGGNPKPEVLEEIATILGLDYKALFHVREDFINYELLKPRHSVAHGERRPITNNELENAKNYVLNIIDEYTSAIMEAAMNNNHMREKDNSA